LFKFISIPLLLVCGLYAADFETCPASINVQPQQLAKALPGWTASKTDMSQSGGGNHVLWFVKMYDGDPKDKADLVPDTNSRLNRSWTLSGSRNGFWMECHYTRTTIVLARPLPGGLKACVVTFTPDETLDGQQVIKQISCR
jgi:hypothetical protein